MPEPCTAATNDSGDVVISCPDGTSVTVPSGTDGQDGAVGQDASPCSISVNSDGTYNVPMAARWLSPMAQPG